MDRYLNVWYRREGKLMLCCYVQASSLGMTPGKVMLENERTINRIGLPGVWMVKFYVENLIGNKRTKLTRSKVLHLGSFFNELYKMPDKEKYKLEHRKIDLQVILELIDTMRFIPSSIVYNHEHFERLLYGGI